MTQKDKTIYKTCRETAGYTQERAAELLNVSVRNIARYESGETQVPDDVAYQMVMLYNSQYLAVQHLRISSRLGAALLPAVEPCNLQTATIRLVNRVLAFADKHRDRQLLQIAEDGVISEEERPLFDEIVRDLDDIIKQCTEIKISTENE